MGIDRVAALAAFARATRSYWTRVFPAVRRELRGWRSSAHAIPDPALRACALRALAKRGNMEGAAAFATFAPRARRDAVVRATVAFQSAYNHLDVLSEQPSASPYENSRRLHQALLVALDPAAPHVDYYAHHGRDRDGGHLHAMVDACRAALAELPSYPALAPAARRAAERVVAFQAHQAGGDADGEMERWARAQTPPGADLRWWETAAAAGSSLGVHVTIATAAERDVDPGRVAALERAYFPWIGALHSLLDHLIDREEDAASAQRNLIDRCASPEQAAERMSLLARRALDAARALSPGHRHELIVAAMASFYLSAPEASAPAVLPIREAVLDAFGPLASPPMAVFAARRAAEHVYYAGRRHGDRDAAAQTLALAPVRR